ncbi:E7 [Gammapapillomavirus 11]|uniref:Protein E7 n=1 Tax=Gammapapillomavirus 11 TaxID=1513256 RepID=A0A2D2ALK8_9PAPI|nr:E7 [Gammapapillomavirus 11]
MMGEKPTLKDIVLEEQLADMVMPANLLCEESLSPDDTPEEESLSPYQVDSLCKACNKRVRLFVVATAGAIFVLEQLLFQNLSIVCPVCSRSNLHHGRS